jgi:hypothetical protein
MFSNLIIVNKAKAGDKCVTVVTNEQIVRIQQKSRDSTLNAVNGNYEDMYGNLHKSNLSQLINR